MKKRNRFLGLMLTGAMVAGCLAGCSGGDKDQTTDENRGTIENPEEITAELTLWDASWNENITPGLIEKFNEQYPGIKVNVEYFPSDGMSDKYLTALTNGGSSGPDLVSVNNEWISTFVAGGGLMNMDHYIEANDYDMSDFYDGALDGITINGSVYALPYRAETHGLFYNADMFQEAGYDAVPETWEEFLGAAVKITEDSGGEVKGIAVPGGEWGNTTYQLINMILCADGDILNEDNTECVLDSEEAIKAAEYFVDLSVEHQVVPDSILENDNAAGRTLFAEEKVASFMTGAYDIATIQDLNPDLNMGTAMVPVFDGADRHIIFAGWSTAVSAHTEEPDAAWLLAEFLAQPENSVEYSTTFSARKSMADDEKYTGDPLLSSLAESLQYGEPLPVIPEITQIRQTLYEYIQLALSGEMTAEEAMTQTTEEVNDLLQ